MVHNCVRRSQTLAALFTFRGIFAEIQSLCTLRSSLLTAESLQLVLLVVSSITDGLFDASTHSQTPKLHVQAQNVNGDDAIVSSIMKYVDRLEFICYKIYRDIKAKLARGDDVSKILLPMLNFSNMVVYSNAHNNPAARSTSSISPPPPPLLHLLN